MPHSVHEIFRRKIVPVRFARHINLLGATTLGVGALMGAGIYVLIGIAAAHAGPGLWVSYLTCGVLVFPSVLLFAELSRRIPVAGGGYVFCYHGLGSLGGFVAGWVLALGSVLACAMYAIGFAYYASSFLGQTSEIGARFLAVVLIVGLTYANSRGTQGGESIQRILTWGNLAILLALVLLSIPKADPGRMNNLFPNGLTGVGGAIGIIYISFFGYQLIANNAEEIIHPEKTVPRAMLLSVFISLAAYVAVGVASVLVVDWKDLAEDKAPLVRVASEGMGEAGWLVIACGGVLASAAALNGTLLSQGRQIYAMGRDRFLPTLLGRIHEVLRTPRAALYLGGLATAFFVILADVEFIAKTANVCFISSMILASVALRRLYRGAPPQGKNAVLRQVLPELALVSNLLLLVSIDWISLTLGIQMILLGLGIYFFYSRKRGIRAKLGLSVVLTDEKRPLFQRSRSVLVPMANPATQKAIVSITEALLEGKGGEIVLLSVIPAPAQSDLTSALEEAEGALEILDRSTQMTETPKVRLRPIVRVSRTVAQGISHAADEEGCSLIVMGYSGSLASKGVSLMEDMLNSAALDIIFLKHVSEFPPKRIAVALGGKVNLSLMVRLAASLAERYSGHITFLHILPSGYTAEQKRETDQLLQEAIRAHSTRALYRIEVLTSDEPLQFLAEQSADFDLLVVGATRISFLERATVGSFASQLAERAKCSVAIVRVVPLAKKTISQLAGTFR